MATLSNPGGGAREATCIHHTPYTNASKIVIYKRSNVTADKLTTTPGIRARARERPRDDRRSRSNEDNCFR